ncbi:MAG: tRNA pseudouridine(55) synthase TruB [Simkaniaceae bacterium]
MNNPPPHGILLIDKPINKTSFFLVSLLRKKFGVRKVGHCGTLDPFATGVMVMLIGKEYTRLQNNYLKQDKEYKARLLLGAATDTFDRDGQIMASSNKKPSLEEIHSALENFQGTIQQIPPMFSAKKFEGKKLYELARKGLEVKREPKTVSVQTSLLHYEYPYLDLHIQCSSGTYIRSIADELGRKIGSYAHLTELVRTRSGQFILEQCISVEDLNKEIRELKKNFFTYANLTFS